jgi:GNAT superfamily N-acetyltransferase
MSAHAEVVAVSTICRDPSCQNVQAWRLRGMAVRPQWRNCGVGTALASYCIAYAQRSGAELVWSTARLSALTFYKRLGFLEVGDPFSRADVAEDQFIRMELRFSR